MYSKSCTCRKKKTNKKCEVYTTDRETIKPNTNIPALLPFKLPSTSTKKYQYLKAQFLKILRFQLSAISTLAEDTYSPRFSQHLTRQGLYQSISHIAWTVSENSAINPLISTIIYYSIIQTFIDKTLSTSLETCIY